MFTFMSDQIWAAFQPLFLLVFCPHPSLSDSHRAAGLTAGILQASLALVTSLRSFFFCSSDSLNPIKVTDSSAYSNLPLNPFSKFFISISELFSSKIFFAFFLDFLSLIGILILFIYHSLTFPHLPLVQSLSSAFDVRSFSDVIFVNFFFPLTGPYFYFSVCLVILLLKTGHLNPIMW